MLAETRLEQIEHLVNERGSVTASELMSCLGASESTIRRDITRLAREGRVVKVHGGATAAKRTVVASDQTVDEKHGVHRAEKIAIARYAATLIRPDDLVYIDAGSTTGFLVEFITETRATYVTNSIANAQALLRKGCRVITPGGELKPVTEALVGEAAVASLQRYHFTVGFLAANGATLDAGFTTPEIDEAFVKEAALTRTLSPYVLCDSSKFSIVSPITFGAFDDATVLTERIPAGLAACANVIAVEGDGLARA